MDDVIKELIVVSGIFGPEKYLNTLIEVICDGVA